MANCICIDRIHSKPEDIFSMSNGATSVFMSTLVISGSRLAMTQKEKEFIVWLACRDQCYRGGGTVGFDVSDMPWSYQGFHEEKLFLLNVITGALQKNGWELLDYTPNEEFAFNFLSKFYEMVSNFEKDQINTEEYEKWREAFNEPEYCLPSAFNKCKKHNVFLHWYGCIICNDNAGKVIVVDEIIK